MKVLSVVCARAGSKGLANKCIVKIKGKMVVEYAIEYSLSLGDDVKTVVSTDIETVIDYCKAHNIAYILRNPALCQDETRIDDALADAIEKKGQGLPYCSLVYGNIPTRYPELFSVALDFLEENEDFDAVIGMQEIGKFHPDWTFDYATEVLPKVREVHHRRQMLSKKMIHDGHTLIFKSEKFLKRCKGLLPYNSTYIYCRYGDKIKPLVNDKLIIDIDTPKDLIIAEAVIGYINKNRSSHHVKV